MKRAEKARIERERASFELRALTALEQQEKTRADRRAHGPVCVFCGARGVHPCHAGSISSSATEPDPTPSAFALHYSYWSIRPGLVYPAFGVTALPWSQLDMIMELPPERRPC